MASCQRLNPITAFSHSRPPPAAPSPHFVPGSFPAPWANSMRAPFNPRQKGLHDRGGTLRLGAYPCKLRPGSRVAQVYGALEVSERHRHRYEVSNAYRDVLAEYGMRCSGLSPDGSLVEMIELPDHPWFIGCQFHPELKSRPTR